MQRYNILHKLGTIPHIFFSIHTIRVRFLFVFILCELGKSRTFVAERKWKVYEDKGNGTKGHQGEGCASCIEEHQ